MSLLDALIPCIPILPWNNTSQGTYYHLSLKEPGNRPYSCYMPACYRKIPSTGSTRWTVIHPFFGLLLFNEVSVFPRTLTFSPLDFTLFSTVSFLFTSPFIKYAFQPDQKKPCAILLPSDYAYDQGKHSVALTRILSALSLCLLSLGPDTRTLVEQ